MPKAHVNPASLFPSLQFGFSQVVVATGGKSVFISGQTAWDTDKRIVGHDLGAQAAQAMRNVRAALEAVGGSLADVVALRIYIVDQADQNLDAIGKVLREAFPLDPPTSTWIGVSSLAVAEFLVEIEAVAVVE